MPDAAPLYGTGGHLEPGWVLIEVVFKVSCILDYTVLAGSVVQILIFFRRHSKVSFI